MHTYNVENRATSEEPITRRDITRRYSVHHVNFPNVNNLVQSIETMQQRKRQRIELTDGSRTTSRRPLNRRIALSRTHMIARSG